MAPIQRIAATIPSGSIRLEGVCGFESPRQGAPGVVVCHPHPLMGGSMDNNVVHALFEHFVRRGFVALAFNFRGTGRSGGCHDGGEGEVQDVLAALDWLAGREGGQAGRLGVLGYSFGAWVGLRAASRAPERILLAGAVAPPVGLLPFGFLSGYPGHCFFVFGDRDPYCPPAQQPGLLDGPAGRREGRVLPGADHFFWDRESEAASYLVGRFLATLAALPE